MAINRKPYDDQYTDVAKLRAQLAAQEALKPAAYTSQYATNMADALDAIQNRPKFSYDANSDALYQAMKSTAVNEGRRASADVMGQAAALTGGYGNSYAASAAAAAYQNRLAQLANNIPSLAQFAANRYDAETNDLYNRYNIYRQADADDYGRYRDKVSDYQNTMDRLLNRLNSEQNRAESMYQYDTNREWQQQQFDYQKEQDALDREYQRQQDELANSYKWASLAQSNNEAALKAQLADLKGQLAAAGPTAKPSGETTRKIIDKITSEGMNAEEAANYLEKNYEGVYSADSLYDILKTLYLNQSQGVNKGVGTFMVNNAIYQNTGNGIKRIR